jgi:hypothetical protein
MSTVRPISERVQAFLDLERPTGVMLDPVSVTAQAIAAATFYRGFALLEEHWGRLEDDPLAPPLMELDGNTLLTDSEWALIKPLFLLYVERETALMLEASRGLGVDVFGRATSEIAGDITAIEQEMAHRAFVYPAFTV